MFHVPFLGAVAATLAADSVVRQPCAPRWDIGIAHAEFGPSGLQYPVAALAVFDDGTGPALFAGGAFQTIGRLSASWIAKWNGVRWSALGAGIAGAPTDRGVFALRAFDDGNGPALYVGGQFTSAGGLPANGFAKWDGVTWSPMDAGTGSVIRALEVFDSDGPGPIRPVLYVGGGFSSIGGVEAHGIAGWDGNTWFAFPSVHGGVYALAVADVGEGPELFAGGRFYGSPNPAMQSIVRWDGASWAPLGPGLFTGDGAVFALTAFDDGSGPALYAGGKLGSAGGLTLGSIGRWNGSAWSSVGGGVGGALPHGVPWFHVFSLIPFDDDGTGPRASALFVGGDFTAAGAQQLPAGGIARWDGHNWSSLGSDAGTAILALSTFDDGGIVGPSLIAGGRYLQIQPFPSRPIARWVSEPLQGDANHDRRVSFIDLSIVLTHFGASAPAGPPSPGDLNMDSRVDIEDLALALSGFGGAC